jgi:L-asparaginase
MALKNAIVVALALTVSCASASAVLFDRATNATNTTNPFVFTNANGLNFTQMNTTLPNITVFATGKNSFYP